MKRAIAVLLVALAACPKTGVVPVTAPVEAYVWKAGAPLAQGRLEHTATRLNDGRILAVGGEYQDGATWKLLDSVELYDPATGAWSPTGAMSVHRSSHTATLLGDGSVLVVGGLGGTDPTDKRPLASAEVYKPYAGRWAAIAPLNEARTDHTATLLRDGRVLVVGGEGPSGIAGCEIYHPTTGRWTPLAPMAMPRRGHTAVELADGRILVAGGLGDDGVLASVEVFDPSKNRWVPAPDMREPRDGHAAVVLPDGRVLVIGGYQLHGYAEAEITGSEVYDPLRNEWRPIGDLAIARRGHAAAVLPDGRVVVLGGSSNHSTVGTPEVLDPGAGRWTSLADLPEKLFGAATVLTRDGGLLVLGGWNQFDRQSEVVMVFQPDQS